MRVEIYLWGWSAGMVTLGTAMCKWKGEWEEGNNGIWYLCSEMKGFCAFIQREKRLSAIGCPQRPTEGKEGARIIWGRLFPLYSQF